MGKTRPAVIVSFKHTLTGHCLVLPTSTDPQEGESGRWAHKLSLEIEKGKMSYVVCNHPHTVSTARLQMLWGKSTPRLDIQEFRLIIDKLMAWLPKLD